MRRPSFLARACATFAVLLASSLAKDAAAAKLTKNQCIDAAEEGQTLRDNGRLTEARTRFVTCGSSECPSVVAKECTAWLSETESRIPTVVLAAVDGSGGDLIDVRVELDGKPVAESLTGTQLQVDPGPHRFRFTYKDAAPVEESVVIQERQRGRNIQARFEDVNAPEPTGAAEPSIDTARKRPGPPVAAYVLGGLGIAAIGTGIFFGVSAYGQYNDLKDQNCSPSCPKSETDAIRQKFLVADIAVGVGVVAVGVATYLLLSRPKRSAPVEIGRPVERSPLDAFSVSVLRDGGYVGYGGRF